MIPAEDGYSVLHLAVRSSREGGQPNSAIKYLVEAASGPQIGVDHPASAPSAQFLERYSGPDAGLHGGATVGETALMTVSASPPHV
eukprot:SAG11_NODE_2306_length_3546_cov_2.802147_5_plen_86_part_00